VLKIRCWHVAYHVHVLRNFNTVCEEAPQAQAVQASPGQDSLGLVIWARPWLNHTPSRPFPAVIVASLARLLGRLKGTRPPHSLRLTGCIDFKKRDLSYPLTHNAHEFLGAPPAAFWSCSSLSGVGCRPSGGSLAAQSYVMFPLPPPSAASPSLPPASLHQALSHSVPSSPLCFFCFFACSQPLSASGS